MKQTHNQKDSKINKYLYDFKTLTSKLETRFLGHQVYADCIIIMVFLIIIIVWSCHA